MLRQTVISRRVVSIEKSTIAVLCGTAVSTGGAVVVRILVARQLSVEDVGLLFTAFAVMSVACALAAPGLDPATALAVAEEMREGGTGIIRRSRAAFGLAVITGGLGALCVVLGVRPLGTLLGLGVEVRETFVVATRLLAGVVFFTTCGTAVLGVSRGLGRTLERALLRLGVGGFLRVLGVTIAVVTGGGVVEVAAGFSAGAIAAEIAVIGRGFVAGWIGTGLRWLGGLRETFAGLRAFAVLGVTREASRWAELIVLGVVSSPEAVAFFGISRTAAHAAGLVGQSSVHQLLPRLRTVAEGVGGGQLRADARRLTLGIMWGPAMLCLAAPKEVLRAAVGTVWAGAATPLVFVMAAACLNALLAQQEITLVAIGEVATAARVRAAASLVTLLLVATLGAILGAVGAAVAVLTATVGHEIALGFCLVKRRAAVGVGWSLPGAFAMIGLAAALGGFAIEDSGGRIALAAVAAATGLGVLWIDSRRSIGPR